MEEYYDSKYSGREVDERLDMVRPVYDFSELFLDANGNFKSSGNTTNIDEEVFTGTGRSYIVTSKDKSIPLAMTPDGLYIRFYAVAGGVLHTWRVMVAKNTVTGTTNVSFIHSEREIGGGGSEVADNSITTNKLKYYYLDFDAVTIPDDNTEQTLAEENILAIVGSYAELKAAIDDKDFFIAQKDGCNYTAEVEQTNPIRPYTYDIRVNLGGRYLKANFVLANKTSSYMTGTWSVSYVSTKSATIDATSYKGLTGERTLTSAEFVQMIGDLESFYYAIAEGVKPKMRIVIDSAVHNYMPTEINITRTQSYYMGSVGYFSMDCGRYFYLYFAISDSRVVSAKITGTEYAGTREKAVIFTSEARQTSTYQAIASYEEVEFFDTSASDFLVMVQSSNYDVYVSTYDETGGNEVLTKCDVTQITDGVIVTANTYYGNFIFKLTREGASYKCKVNN